MAQWLDATITDRTDWNDHLFSLSFSAPGFPLFKAGQFTKVGVQQGDKVLSRPYSIVSGPNEDNLQIIAVPVEEGMLSPKLHKLQVGDSLKVMSPATGFLVLDEVPASRDLWLMATGTGIGPFLSILCTEQAWRSYQNIVLVYGARHEHDLAYADLINSWSSQYPDRFRYVPIVSRENVVDCLQGRIPNLLQSNVIQLKAGLDIDAANSQVMLCGNPDMIEEATQTLIGLGLSKHLRRSPGQISMERYW